MANRGPAEFYFTRQRPSRSVAIAEVSAPPFNPSQLTDIHNTPHAAGNLSVTPFPTGSVVTAPAVGITVTISGQTAYTVENQFFQLTDVVDGSGKPLYYAHQLPLGVSQVSIADAEGNAQSDFLLQIVVQAGQSRRYIYHDFDGRLLWVRFVDSSGFLRTQLLKYTPTLRESVADPSETTYQFGRKTLFVDTVSAYRLRFTALNGYYVLPPYQAPPNEPWFVRVRFNLTPRAPEWARQEFIPNRPHLLGTWVSGQVVASHVVELERKPVLFDDGRYPDLLVYDKNFVLKYALAGKTRRGHLFPWRVNQFEDIDVYAGRVVVSVELDPSDQIFAFYSYAEPDVVYRGLDVNPFTNPDVRNRVIQFVHKSDGQDPYRFIYHRILNEDGSIFQTSDPSPVTGTDSQFATLVVGSSVGVNLFEVRDARMRGGGLAEAHQSIPEAGHFWDLGYLDGKPYPVAGGILTYLPKRLLDTFTRAELQAKVDALLPMGSLAVLLFYDSDGEESV